MSLHPMWHVVQPSEVYFFEKMFKENLEPLTLVCNSSGNIRTKYNIPKMYNIVLTLYN